MAANPIAVIYYTAQNVTGPDAYTSRFGTGSQAPAGVGFGGAAAMAEEICDLLGNVRTGGLPVSKTTANPVPTEQIVVMDGCTMGNALVLFTGNGTAADTVTINGQALAAVNSGAINNQWNIGTSTATAAANLVSCINASTTPAINNVCRAFVDPNNSSQVIVSCIFPGVVSAAITLAKTSTSIAAVPANLSGSVAGAMNTPLTVGH